MTTSTTANLVVIPFPMISHLIPFVELANHLVSRDPRLSVTVVVIKLPTPDDKLESYLQSLQSKPSQSIKFLEMPLLENINLPPSGPGFISLYLDAYSSKVKLAIEDLRASKAIPIAGLVLDMFCTAMIDVASDLGLPWYMFFPSNASMLSMMFHLQQLEIDVAEEYDLLRNPDATVEVPGFRNPVPVRVWPWRFLAKGGVSASFLRDAKRFRQAKGILVNTLSELELERDVIKSMSQDSRIPPIFPVGPILNLKEEDEDEDETMRWLDAQPPRSVVFLCFGSMGAFEETQVKEMAAGLERSGKRFLWSLRLRGENKGGVMAAAELDDFSGVLPEGFLERTGDKGRVIGWAPQARVLGHVAVGGFVSHCGWNSTLESLWFGVPMATWPLYAEQQINAFMLVREMGLAAEVKMDYRQDQMMVVEAGKVEEGINKVMEDEELRMKVKEMSDKARKALGDGGSSYESHGRFIETVFRNLH